MFQLFENSILREPSSKADITNFAQQIVTGFGSLKFELRKEWKHVPNGVLLTHDYLRSLTSGNIKLLEI